MDPDFDLAARFARIPAEVRSLSDAALEAAIQRGREARLASGLPPVSREHELLLLEQFRRFRAAGLH